MFLKRPISSVSSFLNGAVLGGWGVSSGRNNSRTAIVSMSLCLGKSHKAVMLFSKDVSSINLWAKLFPYLLNYSIIYPLQRQTGRNLMLALQCVYVLDTVATYHLSIFVFLYIVSISWCERNSIFWYVGSKWVIVMSCFFCICIIFWRKVCRQYR